MTVLETIVYVAGMESALSIFQDVTEDEKQQAKEMSTKVEVVDIAQQVLKSR